MAIPDGTARAVLHGTNAGGEIFETGVWLLATVTSQSDAQDLADSCWNSWLTTASADWLQTLQTDGAYTGLKLYAYPDGGPAATYIAEADASPAAGQGGGNLPLQTCAVITTLTGAAGRRARGRLFLPANGASLAVGHEFTNAQCTSLSQSCAAWFDALNGLSVAVVVMSSAGTSTRHVTQVRAGSKPDVQRRRANKLAVTHEVTTDL